MHAQEHCRRWFQIGLWDFRLGHVVSRHHDLLGDRLGGRAGLPRPVIPKEDRAFYPSTFARWFGWFSLIVFTAMSLVLIFARIFNIPLFGA